MSIFHSALPAAHWWTNARENLYDRLRDLLDDGTGATRPELQSLLVDLLDMPEQSAA